MLRALWNIFNAFNQPREELSAAEGSDGSSPPQMSGNGIFPVACLSSFQERSRFRL